LTDRAAGDELIAPWLLSIPLPPSTDDAVQTTPARTDERVNTSEYLSVLVSIIVGLGMSQVLTCVGNLLVDRRRVRFYWPWALAATMVFLVYIQFWWSTFTVVEAAARNFFGFVLFLLSPVALFLSAVVLLPDFEQDGVIDLKAHFFENHRLYYGFLALVPLLNFVRSLAVSGDPLYIPQRPYEVGSILLLAGGAAIGGERFQKVLVLALTALFVVFILMAGLTPS
jgi:hypothetical protein